MLSLFRGVGTVPWLISHHRVAEWLGANEYIAGGSKWSSPSQHQMSLAKMTSQSKKQLATSVFGSSVLGRSVPWNTKLKRKVNLYICFQLGNSFRKTNLKEKVHLYIRFN